jgi:hypothetical protein
MYHTVAFWNEYLIVRFALNRKSLPSDERAAVNIDYFLHYTSYDFLISGRQAEREETRERGGFYIVREGFLPDVPCQDLPAMRYY